jgi:hypothetical protein
MVMFSQRDNYLQSFQAPVSPSRATLYKTQPPMDGDYVWPSSSMVVNVVVVTTRTSGSADRPLPRVVRVDLSGTVGLPFTKLRPPVMTASHATDRGRFRRPVPVAAAAAQPLSPGAGRLVSSAVAAKATRVATPTIHFGRSLPSQNTVRFDLVCGRVGPLNARLDEADAQTRAANPRDSCTGVRAPRRPPAHISREVVDGSGLSVPLTRRRRSTRREAR